MTTYLTEADESWIDALVRQFVAKDEAEARRRANAKRRHKAHRDENTETQEAA